MLKKLLILLALTKGISILAMGSGQYAQEFLALKRPAKAVKEAEEKWINVYSEYFDKWRQMPEKMPTEKSSLRAIVGYDFAEKYNADTAVASLIRRRVRAEWDYHLDPVRSGKTAAEIEKARAKQAVLESIIKELAPKAKTRL